MKKTVLLIDDDRDELVLFREALNHLPGDYNCIWVPSPEEAVGLLGHIVPDYIFIDYNMPKTNGINGIRQIKAARDSGRIPVILYSTSIDERSACEALSLGATMCLEKPNTRKSMVRELEKILLF